MTTNITVGSKPKHVCAPRRFDNVIMRYCKYLERIDSQILKSPKRLLVLKTISEVAHCCKKEMCNHIECLDCNASFQRKLMKELKGHTDYGEDGNVYYFLLQDAAEKKESLIRKIRKYRTRDKTSPRIAFGAYMVCSNNDLRLLVYGKASLENVIVEWTEVNNISMANGEPYIDNTLAGPNPVDDETAEDAWMYIIKQRFFSAEPWNFDADKIDEMFKACQWVGQPYYLIGFDKRRDV